MTTPQHTDLRDAREAWDAELLRLRGVILHDAAASAIAHMAARVFGEYEAEIARLKAELDEATGAHVLLCMSIHMFAAAVASTGEEPGTILRATDTGEEWVLNEDRIWNPR
jgi:hypothetical protein